MAQIALLRVCLMMLYNIVLFYLYLHRMFLSGFLPVFVTSLCNSC